MTDGVQLAGVGVQLVPNPAESGTVSSLTAAAGITLTPDPITGAGTVGLTAPVTVALGGTGTANLTSFGLLVGSGTSPVTITSPLTAGQLLVGQTGTSNPLPRSLVGDVSLTAGGTVTVSSIQGTLISGSTGTGNLVFSNSPQLLTPALGTATGSSLIFTVPAGGPVLKQGVNGRVGTFIANGATPVSVSNTSIAITDAIIFSLNAVGGTGPVIQPFVVTITAGTGFTAAANAGDTSTYNYAIIKNLV